MSDITDPKQPPPECPVCHKKMEEQERISCGRSYTKYKWVCSDYLDGHTVILCTEETR